MIFYNNLFGSYFYFLKEMDNPNPKYASILLIAASQFIHLILALGIIQNSTDSSLIPSFNSKYYYLLIAIPWIIIIYIYYSQKKVEKVLENFNNKSKQEKRIWKMVSIVTLLIPIVVFPFLFGKSS